LKTAAFQPISLGGTPTFLFAPWRPCDYDQDMLFVRQSFQAIQLWLPRKKVAISSDDREDSENGVVSASFPWRNHDISLCALAALREIKLFSGDPIICGGMLSAALE